MSIDVNDVAILYVDDEAPNLLMFEMRFRNEYNVITAASGEEGLEALKDTPYNIIVVVSDMRMHGMDGIDFVKEAKKRYDEKIAYFLLTGFSTNDKIQKALDENVIQKLFTKPLDFSEMNSAIDQWKMKIMS